MPKQHSFYRLTICFINAQLCPFKRDFTHKIRNYLFLAKFFAFLARYVPRFFHILVHRIRNIRSVLSKRDTLFKQKKIFFAIQVFFNENLRYFEKKRSFGPPSKNAN